MNEASYGAWASPLSAQEVSAAALRLAEPRLADGVVHWLEGRPSEGGRIAIMRSGPGNTAAVECGLPTVSARSRVHEYGGGAYQVAGDTLYFVDAADQAIRVLAGAGGGAVREIAPGGSRYADLALSPDGGWLVAVEEREIPGGEPENRLVAWSVAAGTGAEGSASRPSVIASGRDFYASPRFAPDGRTLVFLAWDHPCMPWDGTELVRVDWSAGESGREVVLAGGPGESVVQPEFGADGRLAFVSDRTGFWNPYALEPGATQARALCTLDAEFAGPAWAFALSRYAWCGKDALLCAVVEAGAARLMRLDCERGRLEPVPGTEHLSEFDGVRVGPRAGGGDAQSDVACFIASGPRTAGSVHRLDLASGALDVVRESFRWELAQEDPRWVSVPRGFSCESAQGHAVHAFHYPPCNPQHEAPAGEAPPLIVKSHGGPTGNTEPRLDLRTQYWTTRGFAVLDVNYGGSTGYGRAFRELLDGQWGVLDVDDCCAAALALAATGAADPDRLLITGGSAGGYTTLCALSFRDVFRAGASHYGIGDLEALAADTHKFESRYTDRLVGPLPEALELYRERSPARHVDRLARPVIFFQGLEDRVVPPAQAEAMVAALAERGLPHAYVAFEGEGHGFRRGENIALALEAEHAFYAAVLGLAGVMPPAGVVIHGVGPGW